MTVKERFDALVKKRDETKTTIVQLQTKIDSANESISNLEKELKDKWNLNSYEEAKAKRDELERQINETLTKCEDYLSKVEV